MYWDEQGGNDCAFADRLSANHVVNPWTARSNRHRLRRPIHAGSARCRQFAYFSGAIAVTLVLASQVLAVPRGAATSNREAREEAIRAIPWRTISPDDRRRAQAVIENASLYRRLPTRVIDCDPEMFAFLIAHPEIVIDVWQLMGISRITLDRLPDGTYRGTDGAGTIGSVRYLHNSCAPGGKVLAVVFADGAYDGKPFVTTLRAKSVLVLRASAIQETNGRHYITVCVDSFVDVEQMGIELIAKTVQPWINKTADQNFIETLSFVSNFSRTAEKNPQGMQRLSARLPSIDEPTRNQLVQLCFRAADRSAQLQIVTRTSANLRARRPATAVVYTR